MPTVVLDASLVLKWVIPDEGTLNANRIRDQWGASEILPVVPSLFWTELSNGLYQAYRQRRILWEQALRAIGRLSEGGFILVSSPQLDLRALDMARQLNGAAVYDFVYLALAEREGIEFWHSDRRLVNLLGDRLPWIRYIE